MIAVKRSEVPAYLQEGTFFKSLNEEEGEEATISVPEDALKQDVILHSDDDLVHLLSSLRFWGVDSLPLSNIAPFMFEGKHDVSKFVPFYVNFKTIQVLAAVYDSDPATKISMAIANGAADLAIYLDEHEKSWPMDACEVAAENGNLEILKYILRTKLGGLSELTADRSANGGHAACLQFAYENDGRGPYDGDHAGRCASDGHVACLEYLHTLGLVKDRDDLCSKAAKFGQTEAIIFLRKVGCAWDEKTTREAAGGGHVDSLKYLIRNGCPWDESSWNWAIFDGELEVLKYLHSLNCAWDASSTFQAARRGQLECLQYLHEEGCPWDGRATYAAAHDGHLHILKYIFEQGGPWEADACLEAINCARVECVRYMLEHKCPITKQQGLEQVVKARTYYSGRNGAACDLIEELFNSLAE